MVKKETSKRSFVFHKYTIKIQKYIYIFIDFDIIKVIK